jgi:hypothetical protein
MLRIGELNLPPYLRTYLFDEDRAKTGAEV